MGASTALREIDRVWENLGANHIASKAERVQRSQLGGGHSREKEQPVEDPEVAMSLVLEE